MAKYLRRYEKDDGANNFRSLAHMETIGYRMSF